MTLTFLWILLSSWSTSFFSLNNNRKPSIKRSVLKDRKQMITKTCQEELKLKSKKYCLIFFLYEGNNTKIVHSIPAASALKGIMGNVGVWSWILHKIHSALLQPGDHWRKSYLSVCLSVVVKEDTERRLACHSSRNTVEHSSLWKQAWRGKHKDSLKLWIKLLFWSTVLIMISVKAAHHLACKMLLLWRALQVSEFLPTLPVRTASCMANWAN